MADVTGLAITTDYIHPERASPPRLHPIMKTTVVAPQACMTLPQGNATPLFTRVQIELFDYLGDRSQEPQSLQVTVTFVRCVSEI